MVLCLSGRWPDVNPHADRSDPILKLAEQISGNQVQTGLILGLIFLQHHKTRPTQKNAIRCKP